MGDHLHRHIKSTLLILIPEVEKPTGFSDFRSISFSSFASKIVTKLLANRFSSILSQVIDEEQLSFFQREADSRINCLSSGTCRGY